MNKDELRKLIAETITQMGYYSPQATELLLGTCAQESHLGKYRIQLGGGPALGIMQMEPNTFGDICERYLKGKKELKEKVMQIAGVEYLEPNNLIENDQLAICFARLHYLRLKEAIPTDLPGWARYWKKYYNTPAGRGTEEEFIKNYETLILN
ncbi:hypothetical protein [Parabacteroides goldsteinii]|uniref:hypothetical protein n=1 Tax=Parabacteroides goldsteinii TaxID=328812 RepID=UPI00257004A4|nr:hypothetical protein [Parabacteroides goldsteinii]